MALKRTKNRFGGRLRSLRRSRGITLQALARELGVHFTTVSSWERGRSEPEFALLEKVAGRLGVGVSELLESPERRRRRLRLRVWSPARWRDFKARTEGLQLAQALLEAGSPQEPEVLEVLERVERGERPGLADVVALSTAYEVETSESSASATAERETVAPATILERLGRLPTALRKAAEGLIREWLDLFEATGGAANPAPDPPSSRRGDKKALRRGLPAPRNDG